MFAEVLNTVSGQGYDPVVSKSTFKLTFDAERPSSPENESTGAPCFEERCKGQVEITKVPGQDKYCVSFGRKQGSAILFYELAARCLEEL